MATSASIVAASASFSPSSLEEPRRAARPACSTSSIGWPVERWRFQNWKASPRRLAVGAQ
eukprot:516218-Prymnesium_polylepis.1